MFEEVREQPPEETPEAGVETELADSTTETEEQKADKRVSDTQRAFHEKAREVAELQEKLARLEGRMDERGRKPEPEPENLFPEYDDPEFAEKLIAEPKIMVDLFKKRDAMYASKFNEAMQWHEQRAAALERQLKDVAPERAPIRQKIAELAKADPEFAKAPREAQEFIAKRELAAGGTRQTPEYPGSVGGTARVASGGAADSAWEKLVGEYRKKMGGTDNG